MFYSFVGGGWAQIHASIVGILGFGIVGDWV